MGFSELHWSWSGSPVSYSSVEQLRCKSPICEKNAETAWQKNDFPVMMTSLIELKGDSPIRHTNEFGYKRGLDRYTPRVSKFVQHKRPSALICLIRTSWKWKKYKLNNLYEAPTSHASVHYKQNAQRKNVHQHFCSTGSASGSMTLIVPPLYRFVHLGLIFLTKSLQSLIFM